MPSRPPQTVAAVDLGSNSFHVIVARRVRGQVRVLDRLRERVALAEGLTASKRLTGRAQARALACLERFGQRLRNVRPGAVRAVGTNTLRQARNAREFLAAAEEALGHSIEVISGQEEARLIYSGVAHTRSGDRGRRLVVDIGGGSTECILGWRLQPLMASSRYMGCVSYTHRFFPGGVIDKASLEAARVAARLELEPLERTFREGGWDVAVGASGTILAIHEILRTSGWGQGITRRGLRRLRNALLDAGQARRLSLPGLSTDRAGVLPGGYAILAAVFEALAVDRMVACKSALREGLLHDLVGRMGTGDVRARTVGRFAERHQVDARHAARVARTASSLFDQVKKAWDLTTDDDRKVLGWASRLHEVGLSVAHAGHHKHGSYLLLHSDMPGFSIAERQALAAIVGGHRRKLVTESFDELPAARGDSLRLCVLLRLAVRLTRSRSPRVPPVELEARGRRLRLVFPEGWLDAHPLTHADVREEAGFLRAAGFRLTVK